MCASKNNKSINKLSTILSNDLGKTIVTVASAGSVVTSCLLYFYQNIGSNFILSSLLSFFAFYKIFKKPDYDDKKLLSKEINDKILFDFARELKHELKTPISSILSAEEILSDANSDDETKKIILKNASRSALYLNQIIENIDLYKNSYVERNKNFSCDIRKLAEELYLDFVKNAEKKNLVINLSISKSVPSKLLIEEVGLKRVLSNLLSNAIKYTNTGHIDFNISTQENKNGSVDILFKVKDTGIGINKKFKRKIFNRYFRVNHDACEGSGIGLALSKNIAKQIGGKLSFTSEENIGSEFTFDINLVKDNFEKSTNQEDIYMTSSKVNKENSQKILLVDDNSASQLILFHLINGEYRDIEKANDKNALDLVKQNDFDIVLMDINLGQIDGFSLAKDMKKYLSANKRKHPIFIALTGEDKEDIQEKLVKNQFGGYLQKPFKKKDILELLKNIKTKTIEEIRKIA